MRQTRARLEHFGERATSLADWSSLYAQVTMPPAPTWGLRFVFYWRYSDAERQDPTTSHGWQLASAQSLTAGRGTIVREVGDPGVPREVMWPMRPGASGLLKAVADPDRDFDAIVIGSHERAFCGHQFSLVAPVLNHYGVQLWMPELGGMVEPGISTVEDLVDLLGILARREVALKRSRTLGAMQYAAGELDRFMGGRPPFGYQLIDTAPHPNRRLACRGITLQQLAPHPAYAPVARWIFQARLERYSYRRIVAALTEVGVPCPSAADPERNTHRTAKVWTEGAVRAILINPVYTGYGVWGKEKTLRVLIDPENPALGYAKHRTHTTPDQWTITHHPSHPPLVSVPDFLTVQNQRVPRAAAEHHYQLTGLLACAECARAMEATWSHNHPAYRCRHGRPTTADPGRLSPAQAFIREKHILDRLPLLYGHLAKLSTNRHPVLTTESAETHMSAAQEPGLTSDDVIAYLRHHGLVLTYHHDNHTIEVNSRPPVCVRV